MIFFFRNPTAIGVIVVVSLLLLISIGAIVSFELRSKSFIIYFMQIYDYMIVCMIKRNTTCMISFLENGIGESKEAKLGGFDSKQGELDWSFFSRIEAQLLLFTWWIYVRHRIPPYLPTYIHVHTRPPTGIPKKVWVLSFCWQQNPNKYALPRLNLR